MRRSSNAVGVGDELERRMGDDDAIPIRGRGAGQEALTLVLGEVGLVGHQDFGGRIELQEFTRGLRQAMAGHRHHRLGDQAEPLLLHHGGDERERLAGADGVGEIGRSGGQNAPDAALLVAVELDDAEAPGIVRCDPSKLRGTRLLNRSL